MEWYCWVLLMVAIYLFYALIHRINKLGTKKSMDEIKSLEGRIKQIEKQLNFGNYFVRLEQVAEDKKIPLIKTIRDIAQIDLRKAKDMVDAVRLGSMSIVLEDVNEIIANKAKEMIEKSGGSAVVVKKEKLT